MRSNIGRTIIFFLIKADLISYKLLLIFYLAAFYGGFLYSGTIVDTKYEC